MRFASDQEILSAAIATQDLSVAVEGGKRILDAVTLAAAPGEFIAIIGPNGAGKTTLINAMSCVTKPSSGRLLLGGREVTNLPAHRLVRRGVARTFQTSNLFLGRTVAENVNLALGGRQSRCLTGLLKFRSGIEPEVGAMEALEMVGLANKASAPASAISHGERRLLEIAMVLAQQAPVVMLDEPMAGVNSDDVPLLVEVIRRVHREGGRTILMVEHHMNVVLDLAERIGVLHHGELIALGSPDEVIADSTVQSAYMGEPL